MSRKKKGKLRQTEQQAPTSNQGTDNDNGTARKTNDGSQTEDGTAQARFRPIHGNFRNYYAIRGRSSASTGGTVASGLPSPDKIWSPATSAVVHARVRDDIDARVRHLLRWSINQNVVSSILPYNNILDIGSNAGKITLELAQALQAIYKQPPSVVVGVDIDDELTRQAREALEQARKAREEQDARLQGEANGQAALKKRRIDRMEAIALPIPVHQHSIALFQPRKVRAKTKREQTDSSSIMIAGCEAQESKPGPSSIQDLDRALQVPFPRYPDQVRFETVDYVLHGCKAPTSQGWDLILGLSLTKWVHINNGSQGILRLFGRISASLRYPDSSPSLSSISTSTSRASGPGMGGIFLLEPQTWSSYQTARSQGADVRARIRDLKHPACLSNLILSNKDRKRLKRKREPVQMKEAAEESQGHGSTHAEDAPSDGQPFGYPPFHPDDFAFLLTSVFGLEGPIDLGESKGAGFVRPLQIFSQSPQASLGGKRLDQLRALRNAAIRGDLIVPWVSRQFK